jgi:polysaccharide export outer membrane protein
MRNFWVFIFSFFLLFGCTGEWEKYPIQNVDTDLTRFIQAGDSISISIFGEPLLSGDYTVSQEGYVQMPLVNNIYLNGKTLNTAQKAIATSYQNQRFLVNPQITISIAESQTVFVIGEVVNSGEYSFKENMTVLDLVAKSGGFSYRANQNQFDLIRKQTDGNDRVKKALISTRIRAGDVIRVRERFF